MLAPRSVGNKICVAAIFWFLAASGGFRLSVAMGPEFSVPPAILAVMERWQPLAALCVDLHGVEAVWKRLDLAGLYKLLLAECSSRDRKDLSYLGGIRLSPEDVGWPAPYAAVESYDLADGSRQLTRDPGDALWAEVFDLLPGAQESTALKVLSADRKGDYLSSPLGRLQRCWTSTRGRARRARRRPRNCSSACTARGSCWKIWRGRPKSCVSGGARQEPAWRRGRMAWKSVGRRIARSAGASSLAAGGTRPGREPRARCSATPATRSFGPQDVELAPQLARPRKFAGDATSPTLRPGDASAKKNVLRLRLDFRAAAVGGVSATPDHGRRRAVRRKSLWHLVACGAGATLRQDLSIDTVKDLRPPRRREGYKLSTRGKKHLLRLCLGRAAWSKEALRGAIL